jgi:hypothetical protein
MALAFYLRGDQSLNDPNWTFLVHFESGLSHMLVGNRTRRVEFTLFLIIVCDAK